MFHLMHVIKEDTNMYYDNYENVRRYDDVMTIYDLMDYLAISRTTAYRLLRAKKIAAVKIGGIYKIPRANAQKFIEAANNGKDVNY
jgi:excisionase family DNA binding protein